MLECGRRLVMFNTLDELLAGEDAAEGVPQRRPLADLRKAVAERALNAEMDHHLEQEREQAAGNHEQRPQPQAGGAGERRDGAGS